MITQGITLEKDEKKSNEVSEQCNPIQPIIMVGIHNQIVEWQDIKTRIIIQKYPSHNRIQQC